MPRSDQKSNFNLSQIGNNAKSTQKFGESSMQNLKNIPWSPHSAQYTRRRTAMVYLKYIQKLKTPRPVISIPTPRSQISHLHHCNMAAQYKHTMSNPEDMLIIGLICLCSVSAQEGILVYFFLKSSTMTWAYVHENKSAPGDIMRRSRGVLVYVYIRNSSHKS